MKDWLCDIIEKNLLEEDCAASFDQKIINECLGHLKEKGIHIPFKFKDLFIADIKTEISERSKARQPPKVPKA